MPSIKVGDKLPEGKFTYVPYSPELEDGLACGVPVPYSTEEWKGKKVVLFSVPGAFTPTCHVNHLPPYLKKYDEFKAKGVDIIAVVAANDPFVMSGWARVEGLKDKILALSDANAAWASQLGLSVDLSSKGFGIRTGRWAAIIDDLTVKYIEAEPNPGELSVSSADAVLSKL
ncbi:Redoxin [Schizophyllum commune]|uniref:Putative peroxiredoxin n=1 Tax=Schizophyllum commune (strain H4-8 / FGSC 9210) TaxID=578458 RepID=D8Q3U2_SCHCM|nr:Redoxin [Schizophyllum commune H4-8]KAI4525958.1 Redoxin [Schizophyllum commune Loenen D]KAI5824331.1 Redoxin [Schizophyllum commune Tattone D]KAI5892889.1 Redoxin [Schizophyllum commune H4-8]